MKELADLIDYVSPKRLMSLSYFFRRGARRQKTHADRLYDAVVKKKIDSDKEASKRLFGVSGSSHYYKVKFELKQQLLNSVLLVENDQKELGTFFEVFIQCRKELYAAEVLFVEGHILASVDILKKLLSRAIEAELTDIIIPVLYYLKTYSLSIMPDPVACQRYQALERKWIRIRTAEEVVDELYTDLAVNYVKTAAPPPDTIYTALNKLNNIHDLYKDIRTARYIYKYYFILYMTYDSQGHYREGIEISWKAVRSLSKGDYVPRGFIRSMLLQIIDASIRLRALNDGQRAVIQSLRLVEEGERDWFRINQLYLYLCIRSDEYSTAIKTINRMFDHRKFKKLPGEFKERYYLLRAYVSWLIESKSIDVKGEPLNSFRIGRFINDVPRFSKDKMGMNVPVLIIQVLWLLQRKNYEVARGRLDSLKRYSLKYLSTNKGMLRTYYFIRVLTQLSNANFHRAAFVRKAASFYRLLREQPSTASLQSVEVEIVPYEDMYEYALNILDNKIH
ncbi:hypothetical protein CEQ90_16610 [Lewinellaceae bacterium SD302]|nr:hypothetical protein CEQ90_16610 [Lewinellaceae bacterium SD302]